MKGDNFFFRMGKSKRRRLSRSPSIESIRKRLKILEKSLRQTRKCQNENNPSSAQTTHSSSQSRSRDRNLRSYVPSRQSDLSRVRTHGRSARRQSRGRSPCGSTRRVSRDRSQSSSARRNSLDHSSIMTSRSVDISPSNSGRSRTYSPNTSEPSRTPPVFERKGGGVEDGLSPSHTEHVSNINEEALIINNEETLDVETLKCLGEDPDAQNDKVFELHKDLTTRWENTIKNGLNKESKLELLNRYPFPSNCKVLKVPILNQEAKHIIPPITLKRDNFHVQIQDQLGTGLTGLEAAMNIVLANKEFRSILPALSDTGKLLTDLHHMLSRSRRYHIAPCLNKTSREIAESSPIDEYLLGIDFAERCKAGKTLENSCRDIRAPSTRTTSISTFRKPSRHSQCASTQAHRSFQQTNKMSLNRKDPSHYWRESVGQKGHYPQKQERKYQHRKR
ncbi:hypothetical protein NQ314_017652 [Rhamnusium bicolor]|uniref:Uncharacterized protein n=1 Tax=Rhamnusium bicolor TaxID=1586634 RepID=A0AAV8WT59_9CUCU|nr:hypothetical protein NQ314_017652 [Rhamnusium bicolor]